MTNSRGVKDEEACKPVLKPPIHLTNKAESYALGTPYDGDQLVLD